MIHYTKKMKFLRLRLYMTTGSFEIDYVKCKLYLIIKNITFASIVSRMYLCKATNNIKKQIMTRDMSPRIESTLMLY